MKTIFDKDGGVTAENLMGECRKHKENAGDNPLLNPVRRLASDLFRALEAGDVSISDVASAVEELSNASFEDRTAAFHRRRQTQSDAPENILDGLAASGEASFRKQTEKTHTGVVFTAHPTFALGREKRALIADYPQDENGAVLDSWRKKVLEHSDVAPDAISLRYEHGEARKAITNAQNAIRSLNAQILSAAEKHFPASWKSFTPNPVSLATWVGYDLDGRTDIHWGETIRIRLAEKAEQLRRYEKSLADALGISKDDRIGRLKEAIARAATLTEKQATAFDGDLDDPDLVVSAANLLTEAAPDKTISLKNSIAEITAAIDESSSREFQRALILLRAEMTACGLGVARIHLRVNAAQVRSALRADLGLEPDAGFLGRTALDIAAKKANETKERAINFGSVFLEKMTARRQFMLCAQILKHIDADTPIRFLIAECEAPATVMGAVYLARLYGVEDKLDISPLFETPSAIESGGRFIERLLNEDEYRAYVTRRQRMSIQIGFSDSGRFMGQCGAELAIERLQVLFAKALAAANLPDVEALIFNTHGESMGRGTHAGSFAERLNHLETPWVKSRFARENIPLNSECSFQGGEGYVHFQNAALSENTISMLWTHTATTPVADANDRFYADINFSWDFFRNLKSWQEALFQHEDYQRVVPMLADGLLFKTGSREVKRQQGDGGRPDLSGVRAIPHNALLQQLAIPVNISGGVGNASGREADRLVDHIAGSPRMQELMALASYARGLTDVSVLRAYAGFFAPSYWSALAEAASPSKAEAYDAIQASLGRGDDAMAFQRLADYLARDLRLFDTIIEKSKAHQQPEKCADRLSVLHAIRQALIAHSISLVASAPSFSRRHDIDHDHLVKMALCLKVKDAIDVLKKIFPRQSAMGDAFSGLREKIDDGDGAGGAYPEVHEKIIDPLEAIRQQFRMISIAISNHYGAYG